MDADELRATLEDAGLSPYQAEAYVTVLDLGAASATTVAEASGVPDPRIYDVVRSLAEEGYVETYEQGSLHVRAHSPADVLSDLRSRATRLVDAADEIERRWERPPPASNEASIVTRFETVLDRARGFLREAEFQAQLSLSPEQFADLRPTLERAHERGVNVRLSIHTGPDGADDPGDLLDAETLADVCTEARHRPLPAPFIVLVDRTRACFGPHTASVNQYGVLVDDRTHAYVFHWYFLTCLWEVWDPIYATPTIGSLPAEYVDIRQCIREIEPLLAEGRQIVARVEGYATETGDRRDLMGQITEVSYPGDRGVGAEPIPLAELAGQAMFTLETDERTHRVGGWGAILEPIEATRVTIESADNRPIHLIYNGCCKSSSYK